MGTRLTGVVFLQCTCAGMLSRVFWAWLEPLDGTVMVMSLSSRSSSLEERLRRLTVCVWRPRAFGGDPSMTSALFCPAHCSRPARETRWDARVASPTPTLRSRTSLCLCYAYCLVQHIVCYLRRNMCKRMHYAMINVSKNVWYVVSLDLIILCLSQQVVSVYHLRKKVIYWNKKKKK